MQTHALSRATLRRLASLKLDGTKAISLYLNLDPAEFATAEARGSEIRSLLDEGERQVKHAEELSHDEKVALREDLDLARDFLEGDDFDAGGAHGMALFVAGSVDLLDAVKLPRPVDSRVVIDESPYVEPLADMTATGQWAVLLVDRRRGRLLRGTAERLTEDGAFAQQVRGESSGGGGVQSRDQHAVDDEIRDHLKTVAGTLFRRAQRRPFDRLLVGCQAEHWPELEAQLHSYLSERLAGRFDVDVESATPDQVLAAAAPAIEADERRLEAEALERLGAGLGTGGRAAGGLAEVLAMLVEQRVETLLLRPGFSAAGVECSSCGWLGVEAETCPVDGGELVAREDIVESAVERAVTQSGEVMVMRHHEDLDGHGGIAALLRW